MESGGLKMGKKSENVHEGHISVVKITIFGDRYFRVQILALLLC